VDPDYPPRVAELALDDANALLSEHALAALRVVGWNGPERTLRLEVFHVEHETTVFGVMVFAGVRFVQLPDQTSWGYRIRLASSAEMPFRGEFESTDLGYELHAHDGSEPSCFVVARELTVERSAVAGGVGRSDRSDRSARRGDLDPPSELNSEIRTARRLVVEWEAEREEIARRALLELALRGRVFPPSSTIYVTIHRESFDARWMRPVRWSPVEWPGTTRLLPDESLVVAAFDVASPDEAFERIAHLSRGTSIADWFTCSVGDPTSTIPDLRVGVCLHECAAFLDLRPLDRTARDALASMVDVALFRVSWLHCPSDPDPEFRQALVK